MFRSQFIQPREEEELQYTSNKRDGLLKEHTRKGAVSKFGINVNLSQNGASRPPNTITYVSPPSSPRVTREHFEERVDSDERGREPTSTYTSMDNQRDDASFSYKDISDNSLARLKQLDPSHPMIAGRSQASSQHSQALDLKKNDNAFHIVASLIVDRFEEQLADGNTKSIRVKAGDMYHMERVVPDKKVFIEAVQYRVINCPQNSTKPIHEVTRRCQALGLHRKGKNNLLYAPIGSIFEISETTEPTKVRPVDMDAIDNAKPNTLDELARQQINTELIEAKNLMEESVTPETKQFWAKQVEELEVRLRALNGEHKKTTEKDMNYFNTEQGLLTTLWQTIGYTPPTLEKQDSASSASESSASASASASVEDPEKGIELTSSPAVSPSGHPISRDNSVDKELPIVDVVAPADLPGGYKFEAELNGQRFLATVPIGGIQKGKTFYCYMEPTEDAKIQHGGWKDSPMDLLKYGYSHPMFMTSMLCPLLALSQVMERVGLDITGKKVSENTPPLVLYTPRGMALSMLFFWGLLNTIILSSIEVKTSQFLTISIADKFSLFLVNFSLLAFTIYATINTRNYIMERYRIPNSRVGGFVETVMAALLFPVTIAQMGRHTANYDAYEGMCCHRTGILEREEV